jgi:CVNH domain
MKTVFGLVAGVILATASSPAFAQAAPPGSYQESCRDIRMHGPNLTALCRRSSGRGEQPTALNLAHCVGDIGNSNGNLVCNGGQPRPVLPPSQVQYAPGPGYYPPPGYAPPPHYGEEHAYRQRCEHLRHEEHELRDRLAYVPYGPEREQIQYRLGQVRAERERCPRR